jgi:hypothetical protein
MPNIELFVSCGSDRDRYRDVAKDAIERLRQVIQFEMRPDVTIAYWDYRIATPTVVPVGTLAATSLANVDRSDALVAIFGKRVPNVTTQEVREAFERRRRGEKQDVFMFAHPGLMTPQHDELLKAIENDYGETIVYAPYRDQLSFQGSLYTTLFKYLFEQLGIANPALLPRGRS